MPGTDAAATPVFERENHEASAWAHRNRCSRGHACPLDEEVHHLAAETEDIHRLAAAEVLDAEPHLTGTARGVEAVSAGFAGFPDQRRSAGRTGRGEGGRKGAVGPQGKLDGYDLRDDFAALFDVDRVADAHVEGRHHIGVVQRCAGHAGPGDDDGGEFRDRRHRARSADLVGDAVEAGEGAFGGEFVGDGPAGGFGRQAQTLLLRERVHLDHHPVGREGQRVASSLPMR